MELMLVKNVPGLGLPGDVVQVRDGYARNFLVPRGLAKPASKDALKQVAASQKRMARDEADRLSVARVRATQLGNVSIHVEARAGDGGQLYGSVTAAMIGAAIAEEGHTVDVNAIQLAEPIKELGIYEVPIKLHGDVVANVKLYVVEPPPAA